MKTYRRLKTAALHDPWHFCRDCSEDPKHNYDVRHELPRRTAICIHCWTLRARVVRQFPTAAARTLSQLAPSDDCARPGPSRHSIAARRRIRLVSTDHADLNAHQFRNAA
jgi:hypothetical protein